jgi:hypothetical protein
MTATSARCSIRPPTVTPVGVPRARAACRTRSAPRPCRSCRSGSPSRSADPSWRTSWHATTRSVASLARYARPSAEARQHWQEQKRPGAAEVTSGDRWHPYGHGGCGVLRRRELRWLGRLELDPLRRLEVAPPWPLGTSRRLDLASALTRPFFSVRLETGPHRTVTESAWWSHTKPSWWGRMEPS